MEQDEQTTEEQQGQPLGELLDYLLNMVEHVCDILRQLNESPLRDRLISNAITDLERGQNWLIRFGLNKSAEVQAAPETKAEDSPSE